jgi:uncharacterized beta-barrel protein YwiB (DUF1934 family)
MDRSIDMTDTASKQAPDKRRVRIRIESGMNGSRTNLQAAGELYAKGHHYYLRYEEPSPDFGRTVTTVRIAREEIKIIRHGDIRSEQSFAPGEQRPGYYQTAQGRLELSARTHKLDIALDSGLGTVRWSYDLYVSGEHAGTYRLKLSIREEQPQ